MSVTLDLYKVLEVAYLGVRRATVFMGLGVNAAEDPRLVNFSLEQHSIIKFFPTEQPPEVLMEYKAEFRRWIVGNGLRELLENFDHFLNAIFHTCLVGQLKCGQISPEELETKLKDYKKLGYRDKFPPLTSLSVTTPHGVHLHSLYKLRNCLTHRRGRVGDADSKGSPVPGHLVVSWMAAEFEGRTGSGAIHPLVGPYSAPAAESYFAHEDTEVVLLWKERQLTLPEGVLIELTPSQIAEICQYVKLEADLLWRSAIAYLKGQCGITILDLSQQPETTAEA